MVDIFQIFDDLCNEEAEALAKAQQAKENPKEAQYSPEPTTIEKVEETPLSSDSALTNVSQSSLNPSQGEVNNNELQPQSVQTD